jgi:cephalosporin hydroxylase
MTPYEQFKQECAREITAQGNSEPLSRASADWLEQSLTTKYSYHFEWLGRPIIQYPQDIVAMQELIWQVRPDLIIETGIAHGGSLIFSASILALLDCCDAADAGQMLDPTRTDRKVLGLDIDIRSHNRQAIEAHPLFSRIDMMEGSSIDPQVVEQVHRYAEPFETILICLDSNHTHDHVLAELEAYSSLVSQDSYCVVFDTLIEDMPPHTFSDRPWGTGNNPKTAVHEFLKSHPEFVIDTDIQDKLLITVARDGFLRRIN